MLRPLKFNMKADACSICSGELDTKFGHNAEPVTKGRCCSRCNNTIVIPCRTVHEVKKLLIAVK